MHEPDAFDYATEQERWGATMNLGRCRRCGATVEFIANGTRWRKYEVGAQQVHICNTTSPDEITSIED